MVCFVVDDRRNRRADEERARGCAARVAHRCTRIDADAIDRESESASICVYLWAHFLLAKARGRIEQEVTECAERLDNSAPFSPFSPVCSILLAANSPASDVREQMLR